MIAVMKMMMIQKRVNLIMDSLYSQDSSDEEDGESSDEDEDCPPKNTNGLNGKNRSVKTPLETPPDKNTESNTIYGQQNWQWY